MAIATATFRGSINQNAHATIKKWIDMGGNVQELKTNAEEHAARFCNTSLRFRGVDSAKYTTYQDRSLYWLTVIDLIEAFYE